MLVCSLSVRGESDDHVAGCYIGIVYHVGATHTACHGAVNDYGAHQIAHVGCLSTGGIDTYTHFAQFGEEFFGAVDDRCDDFARYEHFVAPYCAAHQYVVGGAYAEQIVDVHDQRILRYPFPDAQVAGLTPVGVSERGFCSCAVGMHDVAPIGVAA